jgi:hypothetical protein
MIQPHKNVIKYVVMARSLFLNVMMVTIMMVMDAQEIVNYNKDLPAQEVPYNQKIIAILINQIK